MPRAAPSPCPLVLLPPPSQVCSNGTEALEVVRGNAAINLVLSDVMMAGVSGYAPVAVRTGSRGLA